MCEMKDPSSAVGERKDCDFPVSLLCPYTFPSFCLFVGTCVFMHAWTCVGAHVCAVFMRVGVHACAGPSNGEVAHHMIARGWITSESGAHQDSQIDLEISFPPPELWNSRQMTTYQAFVWVLGTELQFSCLCAGALLTEPSPWSPILSVRYISV